MRLDLPARPAGRAISLTPLIDVVFILLLFFLLASQFQQWRALTMNAPTLAQGERAESSAVLVRVHGDGQVDLNGEPIDVPGLERAIGERLADDPELAVVVQPAADATLQPIISVIDRLVAAGVEELNLQ
jgi:biopolymer transport protein ExbD